MNLLIWIIVFTLLGGLLSVLAASFYLILSEHNRVRILPHGVSFAIGTLLAAAFWGLIPHAFEAVAHNQIQTLSITILFGLLTFFLLEKLLLWRHCHSEACEAHVPPEANRRGATAALILVGDGIHNFLDGILVAAAFLTDVNLGIVTSLAIAAHEIPQEVGDFAILLHSGYSTKKALLYNVGASLTMVVGGVLAFFGLEELQELLPFVLVLAASSFIYIAVADLIPTLHSKTDVRATCHQMISIAAGVGVISVFQGIAH